MNPELHIPVTDIAFSQLIKNRSGRLETQYILV